MILWLLFAFVAGFALAAWLAHDEHLRQELEIKKLREKLRRNE